MKVGVAFTYTKADGSSRRVLVDPYRLANFQNYWYLIAYDPDVEILKTYYLITPPINNIHPKRLHTSPPHAEKS